MLLDLNNILDKYKLSVKGVIHIGAHEGQENSLYDSLDVQNRIYFEPQKEVYKKLCDNVSPWPCLNLALGSSRGCAEMYVEKTTINKGQSSSLLEPKVHLQNRPDITFDYRETVDIDTLDNCIEDPKKYNFINMDVQGYELEVLKGAEKTLESVDFIISEINRDELYKDCVQEQQLDDYLESFGFKRMETSWAGGNWGDAFYMKMDSDTIEVNAFDMCFAHSYAPHDRRPSKVVYKRPPSLEYDGVSLFTNDVCLLDTREVKSKYKIAWLLEPPAIKPQVYEHIQAVEDNFDYILTFDPDRYGNGKYKKCYWGACWIPESHCKIYDKSKMISFVCSKKNMSSGHKMRHEVAEKYKDQGVDVWGTAYKYFGEDAEGRIAPYAPYRYVIVMENSIYPNYFTEKLIDPLAAGCIPIYRGDPNIAEYFDIRGMHTFTTMEELDHIINNVICEEDYVSKLPYVRNNFENYKKIYCIVVC